VLRPAARGGRVERIRRSRFAVAAVVLAAALVAGGAASARPFAAAPPPTIVTLAPANAAHLVGQSHTATATVTQSSRPLPNQPVSFSVTSGPNAGVSGSGTTDANGNASFTYSSTKSGTDHLTATATQFNASSNDATVTWTVPTRADVSVSVAPPLVARAGKPATFVATIANAGPDTATGVVFTATTPPGGTFVSASPSQGACSGAICPLGALAPNASAKVTLVYTLSQAGPAGVATSVSSDSDPNLGNDAATGTATVLQPGEIPPPPPPPAQPGTFNAIGVGTIRVNGVDRPADQVFQLNSGETVDVTDGVLTFTAADGSFGSFSSSQPTARRTASASRTAANLLAQFTVGQAATGGVTELDLAGGDFSSCGTSRRLAAKKTTPIRQLWGSAKGSFRTKGRYAAATVRGTVWLVQDRCDGTLTRVVEGTVDVLDATRSKTVAVPAGGTYLAAPRPALKAPAQSPAQVKKRGLRYSGKTYRTKPAFARYLKSSGYVWRDFAKRYPKLASALAKRK
jgi:uncharacterized repeat protein (TIGR01451 family)